MESGHHHEIINLVSDVSFSGAFIGAFSSFFSTWQFCIAQISPFFIVFLVGVSLLSGSPRFKGGRTLKKPGINLFAASLGYLVGFSIIFALLGASGTGIAGYLLYHIKGLRLFSGIFILLVGMLMIGMGLVRSASQSYIIWFLAPFLGASFAFIYSPCIPPALSQILNYASGPENALRGLLLLIVYGMGLSSAFIFVGVPMGIIAGWLTKKTGRAGLVGFCCAFLLMILGLMAITGVMVYYKAFLLSSFVE